MIGAIARVGHRPAGPPLPAGSIGGDGAGGIGQTRMRDDLGGHAIAMLAGAHMPLEQFGGANGELAAA